MQIFIIANEEPVSSQKYVFFTRIYIFNLLLQGRTLLYVIVEAGDLELLKLALELHPCDLNDTVTTERDCFCPIHIACRYNHGHIVQFLIDNGVDVNKLEGELSYPPLLIATVLGHEW